jgi:hypothetical protein
MRLQPSVQLGTRWRTTLAVLLASNLAQVSVAFDGSSAGQAIGRITAARLEEISGLAVSRQNPDMLWVHNDGQLKQVFVVRTNGKLVARVRIPVAIDDVEDIAIGPGTKSGIDYVYVGDIGDNDQDRREVRIVRFPEPDLSKITQQEISVEGVEAIRLLYPDGPHNAETLFVEHQTGDVYIATKEKSQTRLYRAAAGKLGGNLPVMLEFVTPISVAEVSAGTISRGGDLVLLRTEHRGWLWSRRPNESLAVALRRASKPVVVLADGQDANGEAVGFSPDGSSYYTVSEGKRQPIAVFSVPATSVNTSSSQ